MGIRGNVMEFIHETAQNSLLSLTFSCVFVFVVVLTYFLFHLFTNLFFVLSLYFPH